LTNTDNESSRERHSKMCEETKDLWSFFYQCSLPMTSVLITWEYVISPLCAKCLSLWISIVICKPNLFLSAALLSSRLLISLIFNPSHSKTKSEWIRTLEEVIYLGYDSLITFFRRFWNSTSSSTFSAS
jgi:hypothetical protein